jgi:hypothetical protein
MTFERYQKVISRASPYKPGQTHWQYEKKIGRKHFFRPTGKPPHKCCPEKGLSDKFFIPPLSSPLNMLLSTPLDLPGLGMCPMELPNRFLEGLRSRLVSRSGRQFPIILDFLPPSLA